MRHSCAPLHCIVEKSNKCKTKKKQTRIETKDTELVNLDCLLASVLLHSSFSLYNTSDCSNQQIIGSVSTHTNHIFNRPLGRSLRSFAHTTHSPHSLHSAAFHSQAHSLCSLPRGMVEIHEYVFTLKTRFIETISRPNVSYEFFVRKTLNSVQTVNYTW